MLFATPQSTFHLEIIGYENPGGGRTREEQNLLLTSLQLVDQTRKWATIAPFLHTWEVQYLSNWFGDILADREVPDHLTFLEPCLTVQLSAVTSDKNLFCFQFLLLYEATPPWWNRPLEKPYPLSVQCERVAIDGAVRSLRHQMASFPMR